MRAAMQRRQQRRHVSVVAACWPTRDAKPRPAIAVDGPNGSANTSQGIGVWARSTDRRSVPQIPVLLLAGCTAAAAASSRVLCLLLVGAGECRCGCGGGARRRSVRRCGRECGARRGAPDGRQQRRRRCGCCDRVSRRVCRRRCRRARDGAAHLVRRSCARLERAGQLVAARPECLAAAIAHTSASADSGSSPSAAGRTHLVRHRSCGCGCERLRLLRGERNGRWASGVGSDAVAGPEWRRTQDDARPESKASTRVRSDEDRSGMEGGRDGCTR